MAVERLANTVSTTTNATYTAGDASLTVVATGSFPNTGNFRIIVVDVSGNILVTLKVTAISSGTVFATTPEGSDAAAPISSGATVYLAETAGGLAAYIADCRQSGVDASLPSTTNQKVGNHYQATDGPYDYYYNGSIWVPRFPVYQGTKPVIANYTGTRGTTGSRAIADTAAGISFTVNANSSANMFYVYLTEPSAPYTFVLYGKAFSKFDGSNWQAPLVLGWRNSSTSYLAHIAAFVPSTPAGTCAMTVDKWNSDTSYNTQAAGFNIPWPGNIWLKIHRVTTTRSFYFSTDGVNWYDLFDQSGNSIWNNSDPDQIYFGCSPSSNSQQNAIGTAISVVQS